MQRAEEFNRKGSFGEEIQWVEALLRKPLMQRHRPNPVSQRALPDGAMDSILELGLGGREPRKLSDMINETVMCPHSVPMAAKFSLDDLLCVVEHLEDEEDLRSLCLCSKLLNETLQTRLFHRIDLARPPSFEAFRRLLERSPHLAHYPREVRVRLGPRGAEHARYVITALTGKSVSVFKIAADCEVLSPPALKSAVESFMRDTIVPLSISFSGVVGVSASCLHLTEHVLVDFFEAEPSATQAVCRTKTATIGGVPVRAWQWLGILVYNAMPCLTHLMIPYAIPSGEPGEWYAELGIGLSNLPSLVLLTVQYGGWDAPDGYVESFASTIQHSVSRYPRRASLEWRFLGISPGGAVRAISRLRALDGWHTISFRVDIAGNVGDAMALVAGATFLNRSDNYCVRIDEVHANRTGVAPHRSTFIIKGNALDVGRRHVHEDAYPPELRQRTWGTHLLSDFYFPSLPGEWETRTLRWH